MEDMGSKGRKQGGNFRILSKHQQIYHHRQYYLDDSLL